MDSIPSATTGTSSSRATASADSTITRFIGDDRAPVAEVLHGGHDALDRLRVAVLGELDDDAVERVVVVEHALNLVVEQRGGADVDGQQLILGHPAAGVERGAQHAGLEHDADGLGQRGAAAGHEVAEGGVGDAAERLLAPHRRSGEVDDGLEHDAGSRHAAGVALAPPGGNGGGAVERGERVHRRPLPELRGGTCGRHPPSPPLGHGHEQVRIRYAPVI